MRGLGGAGFPAGRKWRIVRAEAAPRLLAVNIDEGEPGTFKDRHYLERDPHRFIEGMLIGAFAMLFEGLRLLLANWRLTLIQVLPAVSALFIVLAGIGITLTALAQAAQEVDAKVRWVDS